MQFGNTSLSISDPLSLVLIYTSPFAFKLILHKAILSALHELLPVELLFNVKMPILIKKKWVHRSDIANCEWFVKMNLNF